MKTILSDKLSPGVLASPKIVDKADETILRLKMVQCCVCKNHSPATIVGEGKDFEYHTSNETFSAVQCNTCGPINLNPRPAVLDFEKIYPPTYHAYDFSAKNFGVAHKARSHFERWRLLHHCRYLPDNVRILDVACGAPFERHRIHSK